MKLALILISVLLVVACSRGGSSNGAGEPYVLGSPAFIQAVGTQLAASSCREFIKQHTKGIRETSGQSNASGNGYTYLNTQGVTEWEKEWLKGVLCHEAAHHYQMHNNLSITEFMPLACQRDFSVGYEAYLNSLGATTCPIQ